MSVGVMKNIIVGTAGHIDHGKTTLIKALTGIDADRLAEEKRRGITIDLGFAHLQLTPEIRLGFIDVPGHERFVRNMLAGVGGMDVVLFVIAADESIKPQTREHFDICRLLGIQEGIIALTKADLVDSDLLELARLEVDEFAAGSFLERAPVVPVSAITGAGLEDLRSALAASANRITSKDADGPARLPIDRAFTMRGFGTVVTGTLVSGTISVEQELELLPDGRSLRVRGLQVYGRSARRATAGMRTAVNLAGIETNELHRGMVLAEKDCFEATRLVDCSVELLRSSRPLKNRAPVHFHSGTAEIEAEVRLLASPLLDPGARTFVRLRLKEPAVLATGDRFILRQFSPVITIAGGAVIDPRPAQQRRAKPIESRLAVLGASDMPAKVLLLVEESNGGLSVGELARRLAIRAEACLVLARQPRLMLIDPPGWVTSRAWVQSQRASLLKAVRDYHAGSPLSAGLLKHDLKARCLASGQPFLLDALLSGIPELVTEGERVRHRSHRIVLKSDEEAARARIEQAFLTSGLSVPSVSEVLASAGLDAARARTIVQMLLREELLVRVSEDLIFHHSAIASLKQILIDRRQESFSVSVFKEWTGISRKYAVPLLEFLDRHHITIRQGDIRKII